MATCEVCGNEFKNNSGLSGHKQLMHRSESAETSGLDRSEERLSKRSERLLLEQIHWQLERLEEIEGASTIIDQLKAAAIEEHKHGMSDPQCPGCNTIVRNSLADAEKKGADKIVAYYEAIPGVEHLRKEYEDNPNGAVNWSPEVIAEIACGRADQLIIITE